MNFSYLKVIIMHILNSLRKIDIFQEISIQFQMEIKLGTILNYLFKVILQKILILFNIKFK